MSFVSRTAGTCSRHGLSTTSKARFFDGIWRDLMDFGEFLGTTSPPHMFEVAETLRAPQTFIFGTGHVQTIIRRLANQIFELFFHSRNTDPQSRKQDQYFPYDFTIGFW